MVANCFIGFFIFFINAFTSFNCYMHNVRCETDCSFFPLLVKQAAQASAQGFEAALGFFLFPFNLLMYAKGTAVAE